MIIKTLLEGIMKNIFFVAGLLTFSIGCGVENTREDFEPTSEETRTPDSEETRTPESSEEFTPTPVPYTPENGGVLPWEEIYYVTVEDSYAEYRDWYQDQVDAKNLYYCNFYQTASYTTMPYDLQQYGCSKDNMSYYYTYYNNYKEAIGWLACGPQGVAEYAIPCNYNVYAY